MTNRIGGVAIAFFLLAAGLASAQTPRTAAIMREKLGHSQKILEALTTSNQALLLKESDALTRIAASPVWSELRTRELRVYTDNFLKAVADLDASAKRRDQDAAAVNYNALTMSCYQCHKHLKDARIAR
jgi:cytochrome c556